MFGQQSTALLPTKLRHRHGKVPPAPGLRAPGLRAPGRPAPGLPASARGLALLCAIGLSGLTLAPGASAANVTASNPASVQAAIQAYGVQATLAKDSNGDPQINGKIAGYNYTVDFYGCKENANCQTIRIYSGFDLKKEFGQLKANEWNRQKRWAATYTDAENDPYLFMDINLDKGGMSQELFKDQIDWFQTMLGDFDKFIAEYW